MPQLLLLIWMAILAGAARSQALSYPILRNIETTTADDIHAIYFDREGLLWIGTDTGLKSFDGYQTKHYWTDAYSPSILPNNTVRCMAEDHDGRLWIGTHNGLVRMDKRTGQSKIYHLPGYWQRIINTLHCSADGTIWIGTDWGLTRYDKQKDTFHLYSPETAKAADIHGNPIPMPSYNVKSIAEDRQGNLYIGTWSSGIFRFHPKSLLFTRYPMYNDKNSAYSLFVDSRNRLWIGTWGRGIEMIEHPLDSKNLGWRNFNQDGKTFNIYYKLIEDTVSHTLWACCREGVSILDLNHIDAGFTNMENLGNMPEQSLYASNDLATNGDGNIWIATQNNGIKRLNTHPSEFRFTPIGQNSHIIPFVNAIYTENGDDFLLGLYPNGIIHFNRKSGRILRNKEIEKMSDIEERIFATTTPVMAKRYNGDLWMANQSYGVIVVPQKGKAYPIWEKKNLAINDGYVNTVYAARDGKMWVGTRGGLNVISRDDRKEIIRMKHGNDDFSNCDVRGICEDRKGNIWIATGNEGIIKIAGNLNLHYCPQNGNYPIYDATNCFEDSRGCLWAISNSGGLFRYDEQSDKFIPMNREFQISGTHVYAINEDAFGNLWLSTDKALVRLSFQKNNPQPEVTNYSEENGVKELKFMSNATFRHGNELYFGTQNGFYSFIPQNKTDRQIQKPARLIVTDIYIDDTPIEELDSATRSLISPEMPLHARKVVIPASISKFAVEFALLSYSHQNKYAYWLEGYDSDWRFSDAILRRAIYENLPSGTYTLHLKATGNNGKWTELPYTIEIQIQPAWYLTRWAWIVYFLLAVMATYGIIRWYKNHLTTQNRLQMNNVFTHITHELLTPLTVIAASIDELHKEAPEHEGRYRVMQHNISRLTRLLRQILEVQKSQEGQLKLKVSKGNLTAFIHSECENLRPLADTNGQQIEMKLEEVTGYFDSDKIDKILYNLLSNALKYSKAGGRVVVSLQEKDGIATLTVGDEGIGISRDKMKHLYSKFLDGDYRRMSTEGTGIGLSLTYELVKLHHGSIDCRSEEGKGTVFTVTLPISKDSYHETETDQTFVETIIPDHTPSEKAVLPSLKPDKENEKEYTVLIVEDNTELLCLMQRLLSKRYKVMTAQDGQQALNIIRKEELDIVISDVMMPIMDGIELTRAIKNSPDFAQLPVVLLTAKTSQEDRNLGYGTGADEYLTKPFRLADLQLRIDNIIRNRENIRRRFSRQTEFAVEEQHYSSPDELFIERAIRCVKEHLSEYSREAFARDMNVSSSTLYNKLRALTGQSISSFIMSIRMKEACRIVRQNPDIRVNELAMEVGITTPKYFTKCFKEEFGMLPSEYIEKVKTEESDNTSATNSN